MAFESQSNVSFGFKEQSGYTTVADVGAVTTWTWLDLLEPPTWNFGRVIEAVPKGLTGSRMSAPAPIAGSRDNGTVTFRMRLSSQPSGYDVTSDSPGAAVTDNPLIYLLNGFFGTASVGTYAAAGVFGAASNTANTWIKSSGSWALDSGAMYAVGTAATTTNAFGWVSTQSAGTATLAQDTVDPNSLIAGGDFSSLHLQHTVTLSPAAALAPTPITFRLVNNTDEDLIAVGAMPSRCTLTLPPGQVGIVEFEYVFAWQNLEGSAAFAVQTPTTYQTVPGFMDINGGRAQLGGVSGDGTADTGTCGIGALTVTITHDIEPIPCHGSGGLVYYDVSNRLITDTEVSIEATVATGDNFQSSTDHNFDTWLETPTSKSISLEVGKAPGALFGLFAPACYLQEQAQRQTMGAQGTLVGYTTRWSPGSFTSDDAGAAGDSPFRIAFG